MNSRTLVNADYDIVIVGGGMTGAILALSLCSLENINGNPLNIALIEGSELTTVPHPGFDARAIAVAASSIAQLTQLGLWQHMAHLGQSIKHVHISDQHHFGMTSIDADDYQLSALGQVVELHQIGVKLHQLLAQSSVTVYCPDSLDTVLPQAQSHLLTLKSGQCLSGKLIVAADGVNSRVRSQLRQDMVTTEFNQSAIIANVLVDSGVNYSAWERFTEHGPIALLPMANIDDKNCLSLVWAMPADNAAKALSMDDEAFLVKLQTEFGYRAGRFTAVSQRYCYPLNLHVMPRPIYHRCIFIGNAAQTLHPIAGQGFNLGLRDVVDLYQTIEFSIKHKIEIGSAAMTSDYLSRRQKDRNDTLNMIELLVRCFSNQYWPLVYGRNIGLRLLAWLPPLKSQLAYQMMGWRNSQGK